MKKGFSLIEIILVVTLFSILLSTSMIKMSAINVVENKVNVELFGNSLVNFINNSKEYCKYKDLGGHIYIDTERRNIILICKPGPVMNIKIPKGLHIYNIEYCNRIKIDNKGFTKDACSIKFKDIKGDKYCVSICVGTAHVEFKPLKKDSL